MIGNLDRIDFMYIDHKILKTPGHYSIVKNGKRVWVPAKYRKISAPFEELKAEQHRILDEYLNKEANVDLHEKAYGFVRNKDIYDNARAHLGAKALLEFDMKDFFDTITKEQVYTVLRRIGFSHKLSTYISIVCTRFGTTPQGAPTSPVLSNLVCRPMDRKITDLCKMHKCVYTRYADDITVSGEYNTLVMLKGKIYGLIQSYGFKVNDKKTRLLWPSQAQEVTGIIVNTLPGAERQDISVSSRKHVNVFRAKLHRIEKEINEGTLHTFDELEQRYGSIDSLQGYANFIFRANPEKCSKYIEQVKRIRTLLKEMI